MTDIPARQPHPQRCIHFEYCVFQQRNDHICINDGDCKYYHCPRGCATHSSTPAAEPELTTQEKEKRFVTDAITFACEKHDAQVAKAEREKIIKMLVAAKESAGKHDGYASVVLDPIIEELRSGGK